MTTKRTPNPYQPLAAAAPPIGPGTGRKGPRSFVVLSIRNALLAWERGYTAGQADANAALRAATETDEKA